MEKKSGIVATREGLFIPARYFRQMADRLEVRLSPQEISIRSSLEGQAPARSHTAKPKPKPKRSRA
jgi:hypothetical protein